MVQYIFFLPPQAVIGYNTSMLGSGHETARRGADDETVLQRILGSFYDQQAADSDPGRSQLRGYVLRTRQLFLDGSKYGSEDTSTFWLDRPHTGRSFFCAHTPTWLHPASGTR